MYKYVIGPSYGEMCYPIESELNRLRRMTVTSPPRRGIRSYLIINDVYK